MRLHDGVDAKRLLEMLGDFLHKEQKQWNPPTFNTMDVTGQQRDEMVSWLMLVNRTFRFMPETVCLAISLLDRFLGYVKVRSKYLKCVTISCFYIAAKTLEEDEIIPSTLDFVKESQCGYSASEVQRMELVILDKLNWTLLTVNSIHFLHIIHGVLLLYYRRLLSARCRRETSRQLAMLTGKLFSCLCNHRLLTFRPVILAVALLSLELERVTPSWLPITITVLKMTEVKSEDLIRCRELMGRYLSSKNQLTSGYRRLNCSKRKVAETEVDDIYDSIKRLYNEDFPKKTAVHLPPCSSEVLHQETDEPSYPQVQPVSAN